MSSKNIEPGVSTINPVESPGRLLAAARESHSISPAELAVRLRLDTKIVKALERDDFENLPAPTFVKGYIRSIAKELNLDAAPILEAYAAHASLEPPSLADFSSRAPEQVGINSTIIKTITYVLSATLILLMALWWRSTYQDSAVEDVRVATEDIDASIAVKPLSYSYTIVEHDEDGWRVAALEEPAADESLTATAEPPPDEDVPQAPPGTPGKLSVTTTSEAWIEIYDSNGGKLYYGMGKADKPVELAGQAYYRLILGNSDSVTLLFNDETIDLAPHSQQGVAQLELGAAPQNAGGSE